MKIKSLHIRDFRGIENLNIDFSSDINVLTGPNGSGKSAILDSIAILLSHLTGRIATTHGTGRQLSEDDITNGKKETQIGINISIRKQDISWQIAKARKRYARHLNSNFNELSDIVNELKFISEENDLNSSLPLAVYYPTNRTVLDIPLRIRSKHEFSKISVYDQALSLDMKKFRNFFEWFRNREDIENERHRDGNKEPDRQLEAVRKVIESFMPGFSNLRVRRSPLRMVLYKKYQELIINQLSDGEKCLLALLGDMARRLAIANPGISDPLQGSGVVLIDEVDLHLHPEWQRKIGGYFVKTFPNCQFILTTHSPQVLADIQPKNIFILDRVNGNVAISKPQDSFGSDSNRILEDIMNVPERPQEIKDKLSDLFRKISTGELPKANDILNNLKNKIGNDPELIKAELLIHRKKAIGK